MGKTTTLVPQVDKSPNDPRSYRAVQLSSGLRVRSPAKFCSILPSVFTWDHYRDDLDCVCISAGYEWNLETFLAMRIFFLFLAKKFCINDVFCLCGKGRTILALFRFSFKTTISSTAFLVLDPFNMEKRGKNTKYIDFSVHQVLSLLPSK